MSVKREIELSEEVASILDAQVASGRYASFSSAVQDAAARCFSGEPSIFEEYGVTPEEVERAAQRDRKRIEEGMRKGTLKVWG
jgi:hypothetical protein